VRSAAYEALRRVPVSLFGPAHADPVLAFADALLLGQQSDIAIVATMRDSSRVPLVNSAIERLRAVGVRVLGAVMNGVIDSGPRRLYASPLPR
jgi:Mrp family chromosome partitioning ATPase